MTSKPINQLFDQTSDWQNASSFQAITASESNDYDTLAEIKLQLKPGAPQIDHLLVVNKHPHHDNIATQSSNNEPQSRSKSELSDQSISQSDVNQSNNQSSESSNHSVNQSSNQLSNQSIKQPEYRWLCSRCLAESISSSAHGYCMTCCEWLCVEHFTIHNKRSDADKHQTHTSEQAAINRQLRESIYQSIHFPRYQCPDHHQFLVSFCLSCDQHSQGRYICLDCANNEHAEHVHISISDHWQHAIEDWNNGSIKQSIAPTTTSLSQSRSELQGHLQTIDQMESQMIDSFHASTMLLNLTIESATKQHHHCS